MSASAAKLLLFHSSLCVSTGSTVLRIYSIAVPAVWTLPQQIRTETNPNTSSDPSVGNLNLMSVCCCVCNTYMCNCDCAWFCNYGGNSSVSQLQLSGSAAPCCTQSGPFWVLTIEGARSKTVLELFRNTHATSEILGLDLAALLMEGPAGMQFSKSLPYTVTQP